MKGFKKECRVFGVNKSKLQIAPLKLECLDFTP